MGKASRRRRQHKPKTPTASDGSNTRPVTHPAVVDTAEIMHHLTTYVSRIIDRGQPDVVDLPTDLQAIARYVLSDQPDIDLAQMEEAWRIVLHDEPVRGATPHSPWREHESHRRWQGPLTPNQIIELAAHAPDDAGTYIDHLVDNAAFHDGRAAREAHRASLTCGRPTAAGHPCGNTPIWLPNGDGTAAAAEGTPCWKHATPEENAAIAGIYDTAVSEHDCPGCAATSHHPCFTGPDSAPHLRLVDGEWARTRNFKGRKVHDARLGLATPR